MSWARGIAGAVAVAISAVDALEITPLVACRYAWNEANTELTCQHAGELTPDTAIPVSCTVNIWSRNLSFKARAQHGSIRTRWRPATRSASASACSALPAPPFDASGGRRGA